MKLRLRKITFFIGVGFRVKEGLLKPGHGYLRRADSLLG
jgi:hypothetical protein